MHILKDRITRIFISFFVGLFATAIMILGMWYFPLMTIIRIWKFDLNSALVSMFIGMCLMSASNPFVRLAHLLIIDIESEVQS